jgi:hypothetical protein
MDSGLDVYLYQPQGSSNCLPGLCTTHRRQLRAEHTIPKRDAEKLRRRMAVHCDTLRQRQACGECAWCTLEGLGDRLTRNLDSDPRVWDG